MTTISPAYADKLRRLQELLPGAGLLDECPCNIVGQQCNACFGGTRPLTRCWLECINCGGTGTVAPPLEVLLGRLVRANRLLVRPAVWNSWLDKAIPEYALLDSMLAALGEKP